ncbi:MAG: class I SAM-dependent methyltransferase [Deltaproteobacteria bacterium]|nr:class I SAM-dependent methyltransferase [Deltaproteobacteria bacterium]
MTISEKRDEARERGFWNARASDFPRWKDHDNAYELGMLETVRRLGADFRGKTVLDVGAGSGQYTLEIARVALKVVAADVSEEMLRLSGQDAARLGIANVEYVLSGWESFEADAPFDIVFCMMCPAAKNDATREKLFSLARERVVVTGFHRHFPPAGLAEMLGRRGMEPRDLRNGPEMREFLDRTGRSYAWELKEGTWKIPYTREKYARMLRAFLEDRGIEPDPGEVETYADELAAGGTDEGGFTVERPYSVEVIVCPAG